VGTGAVVVTTIAAAPAKERARCLFMCRTVRVDR
jgi:hypothetical protein